MGGRTNPGTHAFDVTPNDAADLVARSLYIGGAGDVKVTMLSGAVVTFRNRPVGEFPHQVTRVWATGTTASLILGIL